MVSEIHKPLYHEENETVDDINEYEILNYYYFSLLLLNKKMKMNEDIK